MTKAERGVASLRFKVVIAIAGLVLAALVLRNAVVVIGNDLGAPLGLSARIWPSDGTLEQTDELLVTPEIDWKRRNPAEVTAAAQRARRLDPLDEWPFALQGMVETKNGNSASAQKLFAEANKRNLRAPLPHLLLLMADARTGDANLTLVRLVRFMDQWPQFSDPLMPVIKQLFALEKRDAIVALLDKNPAVRTRIIENLSRLEGGETIAMELLARPGVSRAQKVDSAQQFGLRGRHDLGYPLFRALAGDDLTVPFDRQFQGRPGPQPYAWTIKDSSDALVDFSRRSADGDVALDVEFFGSTIVDVIDQVTQIPGGRHAMAITGAPLENDLVAATLRWVATCEGSKRELLRLEFASTGKPGTRRGIFEVPAQGCAYQRLSLTAVPGDGRAHVRVRFTRIDINPVGDRP